MQDVTIPLLWGKKAVIQHPDNTISIIDLSGSSAKVEVLKDEPAPGVNYQPADGGYAIDSGNAVFTYFPQ